MLERKGKLLVKSSCSKGNAFKEIFGAHCVNLLLH